MTDSNNRNKKTTTTRDRTYPALSWSQRSLLSIGSAGNLFYDAFNKNNTSAEKWIRQLSAHPARPISATFKQLRARQKIIADLEVKRRRNKDIHYEASHTVRFFQSEYRDVHIPGELLWTLIRDDATVSRQAQESDGDSYLPRTQRNLLARCGLENGSEGLVFSGGEIGNELKFRLLDNASRAGDREGAADDDGERDTRSTAEYCDGDRASRSLTKGRRADDHDENDLTKSFAEHHLVAFRTPILQIDTAALGENETDVIFARSAGGVTAICPGTLPIENVHIHGQLRVASRKWISNLPLDRSPLDIATNPFLGEEVAVVGHDGCVGLWDANEGSTMKSVFRPGTPTPAENIICAWGAHPRCLYQASSDGAFLIDFRIKDGLTSKAVTLPMDSAVFALRPFAAERFQVAISTNAQILLYDQRYLQVPYLSWNHHHEREPPTQLLPLRWEHTNHVEDSILAWSCRSAVSQLFTCSPSSASLPTAAAHSYPLPSFHTQMNPGLFEPHADLRPGRLVKPSAVWPSRHAALVGMVGSVTPSQEEDGSASLRTYQMADDGAIYRSDVVLGREKCGERNGPSRTGEPNHDDEDCQFVQSEYRMLGKDACESPFYYKKYRVLDMRDVYEDLNSHLKKMYERGDIASGIEDVSQNVRNALDSYHTPFTAAEMRTSRTSRNDTFELAKAPFDPRELSDEMSDIAMPWNALTALDALDGSDVRNDSNANGAIEVGAHLEGFRKKGLFPSPDSNADAALSSILSHASTVLEPPLPGVVEDSKEGIADMDTLPLDFGPSYQTPQYSGWTIDSRSQEAPDPTKHRTRRIHTHKPHVFGPAIVALMKEWDAPLGAGLSTQDSWAATIDDNYSSTFPDDHTSQNLSQFSSQLPSHLLSQHDSSQYPTLYPATPSQSQQLPSVLSASSQSLLPPQVQSSQRLPPSSGIFKTPRHRQPGSRSSLLPPQPFTPSLLSPLPPSSSASQEYFVDSTFQGASVPTEFRYGGLETGEGSQVEASQLSRLYGGVAASQPEADDDGSTPRGTAKKRKKAKTRMAGF